jgi:hypothetical protein
MLLPDPLSGPDRTSLGQYAAESAERAKGRNVAGVQAYSRYPTGAVYRSGSLDMSKQLLTIINQLNATNDNDFVEDGMAIGIGQILSQIECSDAEQGVLRALADACNQPTPLYSVALAQAVRGRELAAEGTIQILRDVAADIDADDMARALSYALARELAGVLRIVDALTSDPMDMARTLLDGPYVP